MLTGVLSDKYIRENCWELTAPVSFKKRVGAKPVTVAPSGNMRNSFTFQSPQPTIIQLATNILAITPKKNLPANSDIVYSIAESLVRTEYETPEVEFTIRYNPEYTNSRLDLDVMLETAQQLTAPIEPDYLREPIPVPTFPMSEQPLKPELNRLQQAMKRSARTAYASETRTEKIYTRTPGIPGVYGGLERQPDSPSPLLPSPNARQLTEQMRASYGP